LIAFLKGSIFTSYEKNIPSTTLYLNDKLLFC
jgi:hypothetical protein